MLYPPAHVLAFSCDCGQVQVSKNNAMIYACNIFLENCSMKHE